MASSQLFKTELILNFLGFIIDVDPGPVLIVEPRAADAESLSKDRLAPMLRATPCLKGKVRDAKSRDSDNTIDHKSFDGGHVTMVGANAPSGLAMRPIRYLLMDEVDRYPASAGTEGDPVNLAKRRTDEFFWNKKIIQVSSPGMEGVSRIADLFSDSDQRYPYVPCPECGEFQILEFERLVYSEEQGRAKIASFRCAHCEALIQHHKKAWMLKRGEWRAHNPASSIPGFWINQMYSTRRTWGDMAEEYLRVKDKPETLQTYINTVLGRTYKQTGEAPDWQRLVDKAESYQRGIIPAGALCLVAGVDVQKDRIEAELVGFNRREWWSVDFRVMEGDTSKAEVWQKLTDLLNERFRHESGVEMSILRMAVDSGYATQQAYAWGRLQGGSRVMVTKGLSQEAAAAIGKPTQVDVSFQGKVIKRGLLLWPVTVGLYKEQIYGQLRLDATVNDGVESFPKGYCHFPKYDQEFFKQLTAEQLVTTVNKRTGFRKREWQKTRDRNEALDCRVYAMAAAANAGKDSWSEHRWLKLESAFMVAPPEPPKFEALEIAPADIPLTRAALIASRQAQQQTARTADGRTVTRSSWGAGFQRG